MPKVTLKNGAVIEFDDPKFFEMLLTHAGDVPLGPLEAAIGHAPAGAPPVISIVDQKIAASQDHPIGTTYIYSSGYLQQRGDVLRYEGAWREKPRKKGDPEGALKLRYVTIGRRINGVFEAPRSIIGSYVFLGEDEAWNGGKGMLNRGLQPESAKRDLIVLSFPKASPTQAKSPEPPVSPPISQSEAKPPAPPSPPVEPPKFQNFTAWHESRLDVYRKFTEEVRDYNKLIEMCAPKVFQIDGEHFLELLSFTTKAPFKGEPPKGFLVVNWVYDDETATSKHPFFVPKHETNGEESFCTFLKNRAGEQRMRKWYRLPKSGGHLLRIFAADSGLVQGNQNVEERFYVIGLKTKYEGHPLTLPDYQDLRPKLKLRPRTKG